MDFSENISHAIIRGLCNRAEGGREGSDKKGRLSLMVGERGELGCLQSWAWLQREGWVYGNITRERSPLASWISAKRMTKSLAACPLRTAPPGVPGHGQKRGRTRGCCNASAERGSWSQPHIWDGLWARMVHSLPSPCKAQGTWAGLVRTRMMTLGVKSGSLSSKLLGNYFLVGNCRENTQPFNLR